jgi:hypothetical protein
VFSSVLEAEGHLCGELWLPLSRCASEMRKSRPVLSGHPLPAEGQSGATAPETAAAHHLRLTSRLWFAPFIFRNNDSIVFWGLEVISRQKSNVIFLRNRISGFLNGLFGKDFWSFSSNWDFLSRKESWESSVFPLFLLTSASDSVMNECCGAGSPSSWSLTLWKFPATQLRKKHPFFFGILPSKLWISNYAL